MKWSYTVARVSGIDIKIHATFALILALGAFQWGFPKGLAGESSFAGAVFGMGLMILLFTCVVLHELGHSLVAQRFGLTVREIVLLPIGGVARLEKNPEKPLHELLIALAGPLVNVAIAVLLFFAGGVALNFGLVEAQSLLTADGPPTLATLWGWLFLANVGLAVFNMIPAFPMDGGRALRALLAERLEYVRATEIAANLGQGLALVFGFLGLFSNPFLIFIALFVWMGASGESASVGVRSAIAGIPVSRAMITDFRTLRAFEPLQRAAELVITGSQQDFPVVEEDGRIVGILTRDALVRALSEHGLAGYVGDVMTRTFQTADARELLEQAFARLQECACPVLPVLDNGRLVGLVTADNIGEYVMIRGALRRA